MNSILPRYLQENLTFHQVRPSYKSSPVHKVLHLLVSIHTMQAFYFHFSLLLSCLYAHTSSDIFLCNKKHHVEKSSRNFKFKRRLKITDKYLQLIFQNEITSERNIIYLTEKNKTCLIFNIIFFPHYLELSFLFIQIQGSKCTLKIL